MLQVLQVRRVRRVRGYFRCVAPSLLALGCLTMSVSAQEAPVLANVLRARFAADLEATAQKTDGVVGFVVREVGAGC